MGYEAAIANPNPDSPRSAEDEQDELRFELRFEFVFASTTLYLKSRRSLGAFSCQLQRSQFSFWSNTLLHVARSRCGFVT